MTPPSRYGIVMSAPVCSLSGADYRVNETGTTQRSSVDIDVDKQHRQETWRLKQGDWGDREGLLRDGAVAAAAAAQRDSDAAAPMQVQTCHPNIRPLQYDRKSHFANFIQYSLIAPEMSN